MKEPYTCLAWLFLLFGYEHYLYCYFFSFVFATVAVIVIVIVIDFWLLNVINVYTHCYVLLLSAYISFIF